MKHASIYVRARLIFLVPSPRLHALDFYGKTKDDCHYNIEAILRPRLFYI